MTRLRSDKASFVRSPKGAFDSEEEAPPCSQWNANLQIQPITPENRYGSHNPLTCTSGIHFDSGGGVGGGGNRWRINVNMVDGSFFTPDQLLGFSFRQGTQTLSIPAFIAASPIQCVESTGIKAFMGGASIDKGSGFAIYENYLRALWQNNDPVTIAQTIEMPNAPDLGFSLSAWPMTWVNGLLEVVDCPPG